MCEIKRILEIKTCAFIYYKVKTYVFNSYVFNSTSYANSFIFLILIIAKEIREWDQPVWHVARSVEAGASSRSGIHYMPLLYRGATTPSLPHSLPKCSKRSHRAYIQMPLNLSFCISFILGTSLCMLSGPGISRKMNRKRWKKLKDTETMWGIPLDYLAFFLMRCTCSISSNIEKTFIKLSRRLLSKRWAKVRSKDNSL